MDPDYLIISVIALNPRYEAAAQHSFSRQDFTCRVLSKYPDEILQQARIMPHDLYGDSHVFNRALAALVRRGVLKYWTDGSLSWDYPATPREYFQMHIRPALDDVELGKLEKFALSVW